MSKDADYYYLEGVQYPRVTRVCASRHNQELEDWKVAQGKEKAEEHTNQARDAGSEIHDIIHRIIKGEAVSKGEWDGYAQEIRNGLTAWERARQELKFKPKETEIILVSKIYQFAGTADCLAKIGKEFWLLDWKSGGIKHPKTAEPYEEIKLQLSAYYHAFNEMTGQELDGCRALRIDRLTGNWNPTEQIIMEPKELKHYFEGFLGLLSYYKWKYLKGEK